MQAPSFPLNLKTLSLKLFYYHPLRRKVSSRVIFKTLLGLLQVPFDPVASTALFGVMQDEVALPRTKADFVAFLTLLARRLILLHWKSPSPPSHEVWIRGALHFSKLEKIKHKLRGSKVKFFTWQPLFDYIKVLQFQSVPK